MNTNILKKKNKNKMTIKSNIIDNLCRIILLTVCVIMLSAITATALTKDTKEAVLSTYNFPGGQESTNAFNRYGMTEFQKNYDTNSYYGYITEGKMIARKIYDSAAKGANSMFCFENSLEFPTGSGQSYINKGELLNVASINTKSGQKSITSAQKSKMYWLADNMYLKEEANQNMKVYSKDKIFEGAYRKVNQYSETDSLDPVHLKTGMRRYYANVTDDDLAVIEQWIIWYIMSGDDSFDGAGANMIKAQGQGSTEPTQERKMARKEIYQYLRYMVNQNSSYSPQTGSIQKDYKLLSGPTSLDVLNVGYNIKGLEFKAPQNAKNNIEDVRVYYLTDDGRKSTTEIKQLDYVLSRNGRALTGTLKDQFNSGAFDLKLRKAIPDGFSGIYFQIQYKNASRNVTVFTPKSTADQRIYQPVVEIERNIVPTTAGYGLRIKQKPKEYDLALRKYIESIDGVQPTISRVPKIDATNLKNDINPKGTKTTAEYMHPKNPLYVKKGSSIIYAMRVYNEVTEEQVVNKIEDKLPQGLKLKTNSTINNSYGWKQDGAGKISTEYTKNRIIPGAKISGTTITLSAIQVKVELEVEDTAPENTILTNIADIVTQEPKGDRDSTPGNTYVNPMSAYKGNTQNKDDLSDRNYHYKGYEDDDDFEKVILKPEPPKYFDLSLRKFITNISNSNGKNESHNDREPKVDVTALKNGTKTTAIYTHPKNVVSLDHGDRVEYTIRVYNEGDIDGYAEEVSDDMPDGLIFLPEDSINKKYKWKVVNGKITTDYLSRANNKNNILKAFDKNKSTTLDYKDLKVAFKVDENYNEAKGKIVNIAQITKDYNSEGKKDRDSTPGNNKPEEDDQDYDNVIPKRKTYFDLSLRKFITNISNSKGKNEDHKDREPKIDVTGLKNGTKTTAIYNHPKNVVSLVHGDRVEYTIRVYNEGDIDGYVEEVSDDMPDGLIFLPEDRINKKYKWKVVNGKIKTDYLSKAYGQNNMLKAFDKNKSTTLDYKDLKVAFKVDENYNEAKGKIVNIAQITKDYNSEGKKDRDSTPGNNKPEEDDQDYDNVIPKRKTYFDLSLRKFITNISNSKGKNEDHKDREPKIDVTGLKNGTKTTAIYNHPKNVVSLVHGDRVEYTIRVYNEGDIDGYAEEVSDDIPDGLVFLPEDSINKKYKWKVVNGKITTDYLSKANGQNNMLKAFDKKNGKELAYKDLKVAFKVDENYNEVKGKIVNIAQITKDYNSEGKKDRDSTPGNNKPEEDDQDYDNVIPKRKTYFDLSLRKFITNVSNTKGKNEDHKDREPKVDVTELKAGTRTTATYTHPKNPVELLHGDRVEYTIRVYNEGNIDGYAEEVSDDIPKGLIFLPEDKINKEYKWKKVNGKVTTDYLSRANRKDNILKGFDKDNDRTLNFKDLKIAFKVDEKYKEKNAIKNIAQITEDYNEKGIPDRDSIPGNNKPNEDDQDYDSVIPGEKKIFDLALRKIVSKIIITEGKKERVIETHHKYEDQPEAVAKAELDRKKFSTTQVKWEYKIRVTNEGQIPGYAKEVSDYIPKGTYFDEKDNPEWYKKEDGTVATKKLANTLLKPGDSAEVTIYLRWKKDKNNMGVKNNWAEISEDYNEEGVPDIDSVPGNKKHGEDDIDDAPVALTISTGADSTYYIATLSVLSIVTAGVAGLKYYII